MKKWLFPLLIISILLSGCGIQPMPSTKPTTVPTIEPTTPKETTVGTVPTTVPEEVDATLLNTAEPVGDSGGLLYVPNLYVEGTALPQMHLFGNALLLNEYCPGAGAGTQTLKLIRLADGALVAETTIVATGGAAVQIGNGALALCDSDLGRITILDGKLSVIQTYELPYAGQLWHLSRDLQTVYIFVSEQGLLARNLETGAENWILTQGTFFSVKTADAEHLIFEYTDKGDLRTYTKSIDLTTGTVEDIPFLWGVSTAYRSGDTWLIRPVNANGTYTVVEGNASKTFLWADSMMQLTSRKHILAPDGDYRGLTLYGADGKYIARCALADAEYAVAGSDFVWSDAWNGYFFTDTWDNVAHLMFWDISQTQPGADLEIKQDVPPAQTVKAEFYQQAEALSQRFGVNILIAEQCMLDYEQYEAIAAIDDYSISTALATLERCLSRYPDGMLEQLCFGQIREIRIELVGTLRAKDSASDYPDRAKGFAQNLGDCFLVVLNAFDIKEETIYHEFSHVIDKRLEWYAAIHPDTAYSEEAWLALQPKGFRYAYSYDKIPADIQAYVGSGYFMREYSMTFPTEDRATLMAAAMVGRDAYQNSAAMQAKMEFYAQCIRACFDTDGWPERAAWE